MSDKAIIRPRRGQQRVDIDATEATVGAPIRIRQRLGNDLIVEADSAVLDAFSAAGHRVKLLPDTNLIKIYDNAIDVEGAPLEGLSTRGRVPRALRSTWRHHLVQLDGPPHPDWVSRIEELGVDVVEPIGAYALFLCGDPADMKAVAELDFVVWLGAFQPGWRVAPALRELRGDVPVSIGVCPPDRVSEVVEACKALGGEITSVNTLEPGTGRPGTGVRYATVEATLPAAVARGELARQPAVRFVEFNEPFDLDDERSAQIIAESLTGAGGGAAPTTGYGTRLGDVGIDGSGVTIAVVDSGIDNHNSATLHPDLRGRLAFFVDQTSGAALTDNNGHGTHVASTAAGNGATGDTDPGGFTLGLGVAPGAQVGSLNVLGGGSASIIFATQATNAVTNGARVMNNSWGGSTSGPGYTSRAGSVDSAVRDPDPATAELERLAVVFSAGNNGGFGQSLTDPHECKNAIVVGNSLNSRPGERFVADDIRGISPSSSRGPAVDNRILPTIVAPGTDIIAARSTIDTDPVTAGVQQNRPAYVDTGATAHNQHTPMTGTSMAAPHVSGLCALVTEWWQNRTGQNPSAALTKALLVNTAEDLAGGPNWRRLFFAWGVAGPNFTMVGLGIAPAQLAENNFGTGVWTVLNQVANVGAITNPGDWAYTAGTDTITVRTTTGGQPFGGGANNVGISALDPNPVANIPNNDQGWGRVSFDNLFLAAPASDRGPRVVIDERLALDTNGQEWSLRVAPVDPTRPMRITLAWTDAPGGSGANPALQNDLDLEVTENNTTNVYRGNIFTNGFSTTGGAFDNLNNVECVYVQNPSGTYDISVIAGALRADARPPFGTASPWQDFALVVDNAEVPAEQAINVALSVDRSGSMITSGYVDVTRTAANSFVNLLAIDDAVGIASFGSSATDEFPATTPPSLRTVAAQADRDAAQAAITGIGFGGSTLMGPGLQAAADMLPTGSAKKAVVLLSDGYDNGSPDARTVAGGLPSDIPVYTCAMGPLSDQGLLEDVASTTDGMYLYMPTIDDLFLIMNVVREQVTGDGLVANESHTASESRVGAWIEEEAREATFLINWSDPKMRWASGAARRKNEISVRLRAPNGKLLHAHEPSVQRNEGPGFVSFRVIAPLAGQWWAEVQTSRRSHTRYAVGAFVRSPISLRVSTGPRGPLTGKPLRLTAEVWDGRMGGVRDLRGSVCFSAPTTSTAKLTRDFRKRLAHLRPVRTLKRDLVPEPFRRLVALQKSLHRERRPIIEYKTKCVALRPSKGGPAAPGMGGGVPVGGGVSVGGGGILVGGGGVVAGGSPAGAVTIATSSAPVAVINRDFTASAVASPALTGFGLDLRLLHPTQLTTSFPGTAHAGSYNAKVVVAGTTHRGTRFVRTTMRSVRVR